MGATLNEGIDARPPPAGSALRRRKRAVVIVAAAAILLAVGGLIGATFIKSPAQLAAEQQPPQPTLLTAEVVRQVVGDTLVLRGTVTAAQEFQVTPAPGGEGQTPIITALRKAAGDELAAGEVIAEVSGRPLFALRGGTPAFRDLRPGSQGADVRMLQEALAELGFPRGSDAAGIFGAGTKRAVRGLYQRIGFEVPTTGGPEKQDQAALTAAADAVTQAARRLRDVKENPQQGETPSRHQVADATEDLRNAEKRLEELRASTGEMVPRSEVVFVPAFPARVSAVNGKIGAPVQVPMVTVSAGELLVSGRLDPADRSLVRAGVKAEIDSEVTGLHATGTVTAIADNSNSQPRNTGQGSQQGQTQTPAGPRHVPVTVTPSAPLDPKLIGQDVRLTLRFAQTAGAVLAVPQAAITSSADGRTYVTKVGPEGTRQRVEVRAGVAGNGLVEVEPVAGGLAAGDKVVSGN